MDIFIIGRNTDVISGKSAVQMHHGAHPLHQRHRKGSVRLAGGGKVQHAQFPPAKVGSLEGKNPQWLGFSWLTGSSPPLWHCVWHKRSAFWAASPSTHVGMSGSRERFNTSWHTPALRCTRSRELHWRIIVSMPARETCGKITAVVLKKGIFHVSEN